MKIRSFIIAYALVLAILLFAERRPGSGPENRFTKVVDLTESPATSVRNATDSVGTRIVSPAALIPGTWSAGQIPAERLVAPLVAIDFEAPEGRAHQITLDDIATWESRYGVVPQGAVVALRQNGHAVVVPGQPLPITSEAAQFLMDARYVLGFAIESSADVTADRTLARQLALHGAYVVEDASHLSTIPETGSLVIVAPAKNKTSAQAAVRLLAMVR
jgi:kynurenine formamidase